MTGREDLSDVTVLVPARNEAAVIERTLSALGNQGTGLQVILVDDQSSDETAFSRPLDAPHRAAGYQGRAASSRLDR